MSINVRRIDLSKGDDLEEGAMAQTAIDVTLGALVVGVMGIGELDAHGRAKQPLEVSYDSVVQLSWGDEAGNDFVTVRPGFFMSFPNQKERTRMVVRYLKQDGFLELIEADPAQIHVGFLG